VRAPAAWLLFVFVLVAENRLLLVAGRRHGIIPVSAAATAAAAGAPAGPRAPVAIKRVRAPREHVLDRVPAEAERLAYGRGRERGQLGTPAKVENIAPVEDADEQVEKQ
jgi:hypothetical protein